MPGWPIFWQLDEQQPLVGDDKVATGVLDLTEYDTVVTTKDTEMIDDF